MCVLYQQSLSCLTIDNVCTLGHKVARIPASEPPRHRSPTLQQHQHLQFLGSCGYLFPYNMIGLPAQVRVVNVVTHILWFKYGLIHDHLVMVNFKPDSPNGSYCTTKSFTLSIKLSETLTSLHYKYDSPMTLCTET